jgi:hypothetical protein
LRDTATSPEQGTPRTPVERISQALKHRNRANENYQRATLMRERQL